MHKIVTYTGSCRKASSSLKNRWDTYRGRIKGRVNGSWGSDIKGFLTSLAKLSLT